MKKIKYWTPLERAWNRMVNVLFRPFDLGKWMVIGFTAFLANCGRSGNGNSSGGNSYGNRGAQGGQGEDVSVREVAEIAQDYCINLWSDHAVVILLCVGVVIGMMGVLAVVVNWVNSRGQFMFLDNVLKNRGAVKAPWRTYHREANSLMGFQILFDLFLFLLVLVLLFGVGISIFPMLMAEKILMRPLGIVIVLLFGLVILSWVSTWIRMVLGQFVVPLMYQRRISVRDGFAVFAPLFKKNFWKFILYGLILFLVDMVLGLAVLLGIILTCCAALFVLLIPYIGTVFVLPIYVFRRFIAIEFLRQFGPEFDLLPVAQENASSEEVLP